MLQGWAQYFYERLPYQRAAGRGYVDSELRPAHGRHLGCSMHFQFGPRERYLTPIVGSVGGLIRIQAQNMLSGLNENMMRVMVRSDSKARLKLE